MNAGHGVASVLFPIIRHVLHITAAAPGRSHVTLAWAGRLPGAGGQLKAARLHLIPSTECVASAHCPLVRCLGLPWR